MSPIAKKLTAASKKSSFSNPMDELKSKFAARADAAAKENNNKNIVSGISVSAPVFANTPEKPKPIASDPMAELKKKMASMVKITAPGKIVYRIVIDRSLFAY
jgi:hypothetical protein